jgi:predicted small lipoprotein YifL
MAATLGEGARTLIRPLRGVNFSRDLLSCAQTGETTLAQSSRPLFRIAILGTLGVALLLTACGRKGPLDLPPAEKTQQPAGQAADSQPGASTAAPAARIAPPLENTIDARPLAPRGQKRKLPGDILID